MNKPHVCTALKRYFGTCYSLKQTLEPQVTCMLSTALGHKKGSMRVVCAALFPLTTVSVGTVLGVAKGSCFPKISEGLR